MRITRREFLRLLAEGAVSLGILKVASLIPSLSQVDIVRPPGAVKEESFKALCVRCGICLEVCPTKAIVLADHWDGLEAGSQDGNSRVQLKQVSGLHGQRMRGLRRDVPSPRSNHLR